MTKDKGAWSSARIFHTINGIFAVIVLGAALLDTHSAVRLTALVGVVWLAALLIVPRLDKLNIFSRWQSLVNTVNANRKYLGLWAAAWLAAHGALAVWIYFDTLAGLIAGIEQRPIIILELVSLGILILLALLSNKWSFQRIRYWKYIQMAVWAVPGMAIVSSFFAAQDFLGQPPLLFIATILLGLCIAAGAATVFVKHKQPADWLRLGFLAAGMVAALAVLSL
jgi:DMSO/TMAO reductase YedYZ heme-binding membrane subunit